jgi:hypothetical protein
MEPKTIPFGKGVILATTTDFLKGIQVGNETYLAAKALHPESYTGEYITELVLDKLEDVTVSSLYGVGSAIGWLNALATTSEH